MLCAVGQELLHDAKQRKLQIMFQPRIPRRAFNVHSQPRTPGKLLCIVLHCDQKPPAIKGRGV